jgi:hypothetical protein
MVNCDTVILYPSPAATVCWIYIQPFIFMFVYLHCLCFSYKFIVTNKVFLCQVYPQFDANTILSANFFLLLERHSLNLAG